MSRSFFSLARDDLHISIEGIGERNDCAQLGIAGCSEQATNVRGILSDLARELRFRHAEVDTQVVQSIHDLIYGLDRVVVTVELLRELRILTFLREHAVEVGRRCLVICHSRTVPQMVRPCSY